jgi:hypothetical protein
VFYVLCFMFYLIFFVPFAPTNLYQYQIVSLIIHQSGLFVAPTSELWRTSPGFVRINIIAEDLVAVLLSNRTCQKFSNDEKHAAG